MKEINLLIHKELIERCKQDERKAQHELYLLYVEAMYAVSYNVLLNHEDTEDVLQEAFVCAFRSIDTFQYRSTFGAWLKRIVFNASINALKKRKTRAAKTFNEAKIISLEVSYEDNTRKSDALTKLRNSIEKLAPGFKNILSLYLFEGYDHKEISEILGISVSTSKSQFSRAKSKLKHLVESAC